MYRWGKMLIAVIVQNWLIKLKTTWTHSSNALNVLRWAKSDLSTWAVSLSPLLTGKGLAIYASMPRTTQTTTRHWRKLSHIDTNSPLMGFETSSVKQNPDKSETVFQFVASLKRYLDRCTELAEANESMEVLKNLLLRNQLINTWMNTVYTPFHSVRFFGF